MKFSIGCHLLVQRLAAFGVIRVEHLKQLPQARAQIGAVAGRALFDEAAERLRRLEDAGVVGEQAEQQAHQQHLERMAAVAAGLERIVQPTHALRSLDVHRVLWLDLQRLVTGKLAKEPDVFVQVLERELAGLAVGHLVRAKTREVAHDHKLRQARSAMPGKQESACVSARDLISFQDRGMGSAGLCSVAPVVRFSMLVGDGYHD